MRNEFWLYSFRDKKILQEFSELPNIVTHFQWQKVPHCESSTSKCLLNLSFNVN